MTTTVDTQHILSANKAAVEATLAFVSQALVSAEKVTSLNMNTARTTLEDATENVKAILDANNPQDVIAIQQSLVKPASERAVAYGHALYEIALQSQQELTQLVNTQYDEFQKGAASLFEELAKSAPAGSEGAINFAKSVIDASNTVIANAKDASNQMADVARASVTAATKAATTSAKKAR